MIIASVVPTGGVTVKFDNVDLLTIGVAFEIVVDCVALAEVLIIVVFVVMLLVAVVVLAWNVGRVCGPDTVDAVIFIVIALVANVGSLDVLGGSEGSLDVLGGSEGSLDVLGGSEGSWDILGGTEGSLNLLGDTEGSLDVLGGTVDVIVGVPEIKC